MSFKSGEDAVSRKTVLSVVKSPRSQQQMINMIEGLSSVVPAETEVIFTRQELESWLYSICLNNIGADLCENVLEIISKLDDFEKYIEDMRGGE